MHSKEADTRMLQHVKYDAGYGLRSSQKQLIRMLLSLIILRLQKMLLGSLSLVQL